MVKKYFSSKTPTQQCIPLPGGKSCFEQSARNGGAAYALKNKKLTRDDRLRRIRPEALAQTREFMGQLMLSRGTSSSWADAEAMFNAGNQDLTKPVDLERLANSKSIFAKVYLKALMKRLPHVPLERTFDEQFLHSIQLAKLDPKARLLPIAQPEGKVRVATVHGADSAWAARECRPSCFRC
jgi:hypothetical protein